MSRRGYDRKEVECCSDTGNFGGKSVSRIGFDSKAVERCSDTGNFGEKGCVADGMGIFYKNGTNF